MEPQTLATESSSSATTTPWWLDWDNLLKHGEIYAPKVFGALVMLFAAWIVSGWVSRLVYRSLKLAKIDETLARFATKFTWWGMLVLGLVGCLETFDVKTTSYAAAIGAVGFSIGLAFQGALGNFAAGIMLLVFRPYKVGDVIIVGGQAGKVDEIDLFSTTLDTPDNRRIMIPNGSIFGNTIENTSYHQTRRVEVTVGAGYAADIDQTYEVLMQAVCSVPDILSDPVPEVVLLELAESSVNWSVRAWTTATDFSLVKQRTIRAVKLAMDKAGIEIPFPQMDVNLRGPATVSVSHPSAAPNHKAA
ncbi:MAG: mechanosensitive ion channel [Planctomycetes bacterium]|nr:mechanosensitive ion channel [Planctomycetota bacterium]